MNNLVCGDDNEDQDAHDLFGASPQSDKLPDYPVEEERVFG
jgi:hypothetical protein